MGLISVVWGVVAMVWMVLALTMAVPALAQDFHVDPTFLFRELPKIAPGQAALSSPPATWRPMFGEGDSNYGIPKGVSRFGELTALTSKTPT